MLYIFFHIYNIIIFTKIIKQAPDLYPRKLRFGYNQFMNLLQYLYLFGHLHILLVVYNFRYHHQKKQYLLYSHRDSKSMYILGLVAELVSIVVFQVLYMGYYYYYLLLVVVLESVYLVKARKSEDQVRS